MADQEPRGGLSPHEWLARFQDYAEEKLRNQLASEEDAGSLRDLVLAHREDGVWAIVTFVMESVPSVTFIRSQRVMPDLSSEWDPDFAAILFETHLIEWFHVDAKRRAPDSSGTVRN
ncbi:hypothetical protein GCM10023084_41500 [Streptomyces lacrimifluminis]|uniref:Uncharacterized protein n=1 Tax=Streptomyces lacrimifluminis TaxID=1500077 RepID=A0A917NYS3_9ACTN|nr:hypothetical protein GCM10012282_43130 [Streptomyces lacrimifluminis]